MDHLSRRRAIKVNAIGCIAVLLICTGLLVWRRSSFLSQAELSLVGRWTYRLSTPGGQERTLYFRKDHILVGCTTDGLNLFSGLAYLRSELSLD